MRLLIVEDDRDLANALTGFLQQQHFRVDHAPNAEQARLRFAGSSYAAAIVDIGLPDGNGVEMVRGLRAGGDVTPILLLTARSALGEKIAGLDAGGDDYIVKPCDPAEIVARLRAVMRRQGNLSGPEIQVENARFDTRHMQLHVDDIPVTLTQREAELLHLLIRRVGTVVTRRVVEDQLFGDDFTLGSNVVEVYIHRLRHRLQQANARLSILTIRGVGYMCKPGA